ncbi:hypothetical protein PAXINDRAFT_115516 [Paxillus involutus ATCC 200175]|uniref:Uncharacterized protein n=1 Tax=Paxillus involutus ATCC 200175 TaxID=664439 RepID=A0A0C9SY41_PAXIN|nr:hypothetical protein PAXINDRAFT_115516 [Paxillus involutus ATCC 200175]
MVNWKDPEVEARLGVILNDMVFCVIGLYGWEYFRSFQVEWALIRFRLSFRWPLIPYVVGRISLLASVIMLFISVSDSGFIWRSLWSTCQRRQFAGEITIGCASTNLMIRTWLIWRDSRFVLCLLSLVSVAHWTILIIGRQLFFIDASMTSGGCNVVYVDITKALAVYLYTMFYDMLVIVLTTIGLSRKRSSCTLWRRLYRQGIAYFAVTFLANIMPLVRVVCFDFSPSVLIMIYRLFVGSILMVRFHSP